MAVAIKHRIPGTQTRQITAGLVSVTILSALLFLSNHAKGDHLFRSINKNTNVQECITQFLVSGISSEKCPKGVSASDLLKPRLSRTKDFHQIFRFEPPRRFATRLKPGKSLRDCKKCPEMAFVPAGSFKMGETTSSEKLRSNYRPSPSTDVVSKPVHNVEINYKFLVSKYEITQEEWGLVMNENPSVFKGSRLPVHFVSWHYAQEFVRRLSNLTGHNYRLLSETEWEYVARAGTKTIFPLGNRIDATNGNFPERGISRINSAGSFSPNAFGLHDMHGNVAEWVMDCGHQNYLNKPADGRPSTFGDCDTRVVRGGAWADPAYLLSRSIRKLFNTKTVHISIGFRIASDM